MLSARTPDGAVRPKQSFSSERASSSARSFSHSVSLGLPSSLALAVAACENNAREAAAILGKLPRHARAEIAGRRVWCDSLNKVLLAERPLDRLDDPEVYEATMLGLAALAGSVEIVRLLLEAGADPSAKDSRGRTPLMCTIFAPVDSHEINATNLNYATLCLPKHVDVAGVLLEALSKSLAYHETVNATQDGDQLRGITPLCLAAYLGKLSICDVLLSSGAEVDSGDENGATPLMYAARDGHVDVAKLLLSYNARPDLIDRYGWSPIRYAAPYPEMLALLEQALRDQKLSNIDVQSMFRNADYVLQEINSLTEVGLGITDHSQRSTPLHSRPGSPRFGGLPVRSSPRIEAPPLIVVEDIDLPEPEEESEGLSIAAVENLYANVDRLELEMRAVEAQRNNLETLLAEKNKQLARAEAKAVAMHRAYCNLVDYVNAIIDEDVGEIMKDLAEVSASFEIAPIFPKVPAPVVATELAAPQRATMKTISADPIISTPSVPVVTLSNGHTISAPIPVSPDALPMTKPGSIFGPAKLGSGSNSTSSSQANGSSKTTSSFHFRSPLQLLSKEKETDSGLGNFFFGKSNRSKSLSSSSASSSTSKNVLPIPAPNATAAQATTNQEPKIVQPTGSSSSLLSDQPPVLTLDGEEYVERRKKKRQAPILLEYSGEAATMREASNGDAETESVLRDGTRNTSSRKAADSSAVSLVDSLDWSVSDTSMILGSPSEIFAAVGLAPEMEVMDNKQSQLLQPQPPVVEAAPTPVVMAPYLPRSVATVATPSTDSPSSPLIEAPPTSPTSPVTPLDTVRSKRSREPLLPANSNPAYGIAPNMILEARQKLVPVQKTRAAGYPVPAGERSTAVSDVKAAIERLNENKAESKPSPRSGPVKQESGASVAELRSAFSGVTSTSGGAAAKDGVPKKKRTVRKVPRADFGDLYAFSNAMAEDGSEVHGSTPLDQTSFSFRGLKDL